VFKRYADDVKQGFRVAAETASTSGSDMGYDSFLKSLSFCNLNIYDGNWRKIAALVDSPKGHPSEATPENLALMRRLIPAAPGKVKLTNIIRNEGQSFFFLLMRTSNGAIAVGMITPAFIREAQKRIAFGELGHSMVVDAQGIVIAHPNGDWQKSGKDASTLSVVQKMMRGETGVAEFYSPPMKTDMIAGHTSVPGVGWGVMVPQPIAELRHRAGEVQETTLLIALLTMLLVILVSLWLSRFLSKPIEAIDDAAVAVTGGRLDTQVALPAGLTPRELHSLSAAFNSMVAELSERERKLRIARDEAVLADRAKSEFLANMSHELRTPLNAIIGFADMMREQVHGPIGAEQYVDYVSDIKKSGEHLVDVISDVLDMSRIVAGQLRPSLAEVDLTEVIDSCMMMISDRANRGMVKIIQRLPDAPLLVRADERMMKQIILNLLSNAVKYTPEQGTVSIIVEIDREFGCRIFVCDTGIGIEPDMLDKVIHPFVQAKPELAGTNEGVGLGLPLVKSMVEMHDGTLEIESEPNKGTTVIVHLLPERVIEPSAAA